MVHSNQIEDVLTTFEFPVGRVLNDADYDYFVDYFEPTEVYGFEVDAFEDLRDEVEERNPQSGLLVAYVEDTNEVLACGVGQFREIKESAFQPIEGYF